MRDGADTSCLTNSKQLHTKLATTAETETKLLNRLARPVKRVITIAEMSGNNSAYHGSRVLVVKLKISSY